MYSLISMRIKASSESNILRDKARAKEFIAEKGYDQQFGARPLHRAIQKYLEDPLAEEILNMNIKAGDVMVADLDKETQKIIFSIKPLSGKKEKSKA